MQLIRLNLNLRRKMCAVTIYVLPGPVPSQLLHFTNTFSSSYPAIRNLAPHSRDATRSARVPPWSKTGYGRRSVKQRDAAKLSPGIDVSTDGILAAALVKCSNARQKMVVFSLLIATAM